MASCSESQTTVEAAGSNPDRSLTLAMKLDISSKLPPVQTMQLRRPQRMLLLWYNIFFSRRLKSKAESFH